MDIKDVLKDKLSEPELRAVRRGFDIVGDIAIIEVPDELSEKEDIVADAIKKVCKNVRTVLRKMGERKGKYRLREFKILSGDGTETTHREYGYELRLDVTKVYFSPREAEERQRIAKMVKSNESVLVMFAGIGPYAIAIAKKQPNIKKVYAIEINPYAYRYMVENIRINKLSDKIVPILGDVSV
ncbi:MAG: class I SAM-dependent methyltransferase family protein, partial [Candidatus Aenigmatarchaeota archaeon]